MTAPSSKTFADVKNAFSAGDLLHYSTAELEQFLVALSAEAITEPAARAHAAEMGATVRLVLRNRQVETLRPQPPHAARAALFFSLAALLCSALLVYHSWHRPGAIPASQLAAEMAAAPSLTANGDDTRVRLTVAELAHWAPTLRKGTLQAWWAGEQARQIQRLERQAKRQTLAGDLEGAAESARRADAIRSNVTVLAEFERPTSQ